MPDPSILPSMPRGCPFQVIGIDPDIQAPAMAVMLAGAGASAPFAVSYGVPFRAPPGARGMAAVSSLAETFGIGPKWGVGRLPAVVVVESPVARRGATKNPQDLIHLAAAAGAMANWAYGLLPAGSRVVFVRPEDWKGSVPKGIQQARTCSRLGWTYRTAGGKSPYCIPDSQHVANLRGVSRQPSAWADIMDAVGIAHWAATEILRRAA